MSVDARRSREYIVMSGRKKCLVPLQGLTDNGLAYLFVESWREGWKMSMFPGCPLRQPDKHPEKHQAKNF